MADRPAGREKAILLSLAFLAGGLLLRGIPATGMLLAGTVIGMSGLAVCNVAMPSFIREHFAHRTSMMTMLYTVTMTTGATVTAVAVIPMAKALGSPSSAVGATGFLAVAAFLGFLPVVLHTHRHSVRAPSTHISPWPLLRTRKGQLLTAIFTLQALLAYSLISWFPSMLITMGWRGGQRPAVRADATGLRARRHGDHRHRLAAPHAPARAVSGQHHHVAGWRRCSVLPVSLAVIQLSCSGSAWAFSRWSW